MMKRFFVSVFALLIIFAFCTTVSAEKFQLGKFFRIKEKTEKYEVEKDINTIKPDSVYQFGKNLLVKEYEAIGKVLIIKGDAQVDGAVIGPIIAAPGTIFVGPTAFVDGTIISIGGKVREHDDATIKGIIVEVNIPGTPAMINSIPTFFWKGLVWFFRLAPLISFLVLAFLIAALTPKLTNTILSTVQKRFWTTLLIGFLGFILIVPLAMLFAIAKVGVVLEPIEIIFIMISLTLGYMAIAQRIGKRITSAFKKPNAHTLVAILSGLIFLWLINLVPFLGGLVNFFVLLIGLGAAILSLISLAFAKKEAA